MKIAPGQVWKCKQDGREVTVVEIGAYVRVMGKRISTIVERLFLQRYVYLRG